MWVSFFHFFFYLFIWGRGHATQLVGFQVPSQGLNLCHSSESTRCYPLAGMCAKSFQSRPTLRNPMNCSPPSSSVQWDSPGKSTGVGCHALLQEIFPTQGSNLRLLRLLHWQVDSLPRAPPAKPGLLSVGSQRVGHDWATNAQTQKCNEDKRNYLTLRWTELCSLSKSLCGGPKEAQ